MVLSVRSSLKSGRCDLKLLKDKGSSTLLHYMKRYFFFHRFCSFKLVVMIYSSCCSNCSYGNHLLMEDMKHSMPLIILRMTLRTVHMIAGILILGNLILNFRRIYIWMKMYLFTMKRLGEISNMIMLLIITSTTK